MPRPSRHTPRPLRTLAGVVAALAIVPALALAQAKDGAEKRLYRWTDENGKVHYTDALPPEAVNRARAELSLSTGLVRSEVGRQLSAAERRALEAEALASAEARQRLENLQRAEEAKISSFRTEEDLRASYSDRQATIDETLLSLEAALEAQRTSLHQQLGVAGDAELAGRPVPPRTVVVINRLREELKNQEQARIARAAEKQVLDEELERLVALFRERRQQDEAEAAANALPEASGSTGSPET